jgi:type I restriction enzyme, S subunit
VNELPEGWITARVEDIAEVRLGRQRSPAKAFGPNMRPYLRAANVTWSGLDISDVKEMDFDPHEFPSYVLQEGDILLAEASGSPTEVGKPAVFNGEISDCCFQNTLIRVRPYEGLSPFLYRKFLYDAHSGAFARMSRGLGIHHLGAETISKWEVTLPPLGEQRRIVDKIEKLSSRTRQVKGTLDEIPALLEDYRRSVLAAAFRGDLTAEWRQENPHAEPANALLVEIGIERRQHWEAAELLKMQAKGEAPADQEWKGKYKEPEPVDVADLPELPPGWCWTSADQITAPGRPIVYGVIKPGPHIPSGVPYARVTEVASGRIDVSQLPRCAPERAALFKRSELKAGDILVTKDGTIGKVAVVPPELEGGNITQHLLRLTASPHVDRDFVMRMIETPHSQRWMRGETKGIALQGVNVKDFRRLPLPLPPKAEQLAIVAAVQKALVDLANLEKAMKDAASETNELDYCILAKAVIGELVSQDSADQTAALLIARVRAERAAATAQSPPKRPKALVKKPAMSNQDLKDRIRAAIRDQAFDRFSFDELRAKVHGNYDTLKDSLFELLDEKPPMVRQVFDKQAGAMRLQRVRS